MGSVAGSMRAKLENAYMPARLEILDDSHRHAGHSGHDSRGESHFSIEIVADAFAGKGRVERQRMVYALLADELRDRVHALSLSLKAPGEG